MGEYTEQGWELFTTRKTVYRDRKARKGKRREGR